MINVGELLNAKGRVLWSTRPDASVYEALQLMADRNVGALAVLESNKLVGMFSERDYARKLILRGKFAKDTPVREVMTERVITVGLQETIDTCMQLMTQNRIRHLPVLEDGSLVGLVSIGDIVKEIISDQQSTIGLLEEYIVGRR
jgi:CBS domain-containing protein